MFTVTKRNGDIVPCEDWVVEMWSKGELTDPLLLAALNTARAIKGPWYLIRDMGKKGCEGQH